MLNCMQCNRIFDHNCIQYIGTCWHEICKPCFSSCNKYCPICKKLSFENPMFIQRAIPEDKESSPNMVSREENNADVEGTLEKRILELEQELRVAKADFKASQEIVASMSETVKIQASDNSRLLKRIEKLLKKKDMQHADHTARQLKEDYAKKLEEQKQEHLMEKENMRLELETLKKKIGELEQDKKETVENKPALAYKCARCKSELTKTLRLDRVSATCAKCNAAYIVGQLKDGYKWATVDTPNLPHGWCQHFQQVPESVSDGETVKCNICYVEGSWKNANRSVALTTTVTELEEERQNMKLEEIKKIVEKSCDELAELMEKVDNLAITVSERFDEENSYDEEDEMENENDAIDTGAIKTTEHGTVPNTQPVTHPTPAPNVNHPLMAKFYARQAEEDLIVNKFPCEWRQIIRNEKNPEIKNQLIAQYRAVYEQKLAERDASTNMNRGFTSFPMNGQNGTDSQNNMILNSNIYQQIVLQEFMRQQEVLKQHEMMKQQQMMLQQQQMMQAAFNHCGPIPGQAQRAPDEKTTVDNVNANE